MDPKSSAFEHLFDFTPAVILAKHLVIDVAESPSEKDWGLWNDLSLIPPEKSGKLTLNCDGMQIVLKHPISAAKKELEKLSDLLCHKDLEQILKELREVELELRDEALGGNVSIDEVWNGLPDFLKANYITVLKKYFPEDAAEEIAEELVHLPADLAFPDHDWLSRAEFYATIRAIEEAGETPYLLRFKISPVQGFIGNARKERDFWAGSHLLSTLTYKAIERIMEETWPWAVIFPHLRGQPVFEAKFRACTGKGNDEAAKKVEEFKEAYDVPNMPNKVLAIIGLKDGETVKKKEGELENDIRNRIGDYLVELFEEAWNKYKLSELVKKLSLDEREEKEKAEKALRNYFYITVALWPYKDDAKVFDEDMQKFFDEVSQYNYNKAYIQYPYLFAVLDQKTEFKSNKWEKGEIPDGFKCTVCGELPAIGQYTERKNRKEEQPKKPVYSELRKAWKKHAEELHKNGIHDIREDEMLCPLCLVKRWYGKKENYKIESVSEIAIRKSEKWNEFWLVAEEEKPLDETELTDKEIETIKVIRKLFQAFGKNSEVLYPESVSSEKALAKVYGIGAGENNRDDLPEKVRNKLRAVGITFEDVRSTIERLSKVFEKPPKYYAMLKMDGDNMGKVISGERGMRAIGEYLHSEALEEARNNVGSNILNEKRPVNPPVHVAITRSLSTFAVKKVPGIVREENNGELILAGGDDVLALLPTDTVINAAYELQETFRMDWDDEKKFDYLQGKTRSMSAGLLVAYYKEPLYHVYDLASGLEHLAKESGRNAMAIGYLTHSGNLYRVVTNWDVFSANSPLWRLLRGIVEEGEKSSEDFTISSRFIYELFEDVEKWPNNPEAIVELLRFEIGRHVSVKDKDKKREIQEAVLQGILQVASHVKVSISVDDYVRKSNSSKKNAERMVEECIKDLLSLNPEDIKDRFSEERGSLRFWEAIGAELIRSCGNVLDSSEDLVGEMMKRQLRDTAMLLRILRRMDVKEVKG